MTTSTQTALITGGTSGIGRELANCFAQDKYDLVLVGRDEATLAQAAREIEQQHGVTVTTIAKDLFRRDAPREVYEEVQRRGLRIDALVSDAGQGQYGLFTTTDLDRELDIVQLNIGATVALTKFYLKEMVERGAGKVLLVGSIAGELPGPLQAVYHGTKAFVNSFAESIQNENKDAGVTITALLPGLTDTDFFEKADMTRAKNVAEGSKADPADVAQDGYKALMAGENRVISGLSNKVRVTVGNVIPDELLAAQVHQESKPVDGDEHAK